jgi:Ca2+-binding EF-hand superfamily protein
MPRWIGTLFIIITTGLVITGASGQDPSTKGKLDIDAIFKKLDANNDGKLSKGEFLKLADRCKDKEKARAKLTMAFETIDPENMGLSKDVFRKYLESVKKKDASK